MHPKIKILSLITSKPVKASFVFGTHENPGGLWLSHWLPNNNTVKAQKSMKDIVKIVHLPDHTDTFSMFIYALIWTKTASPCGAADTEQCTQFALRRIVE